VSINREKLLRCNQKLESAQHRLSVLVKGASLIQYKWTTQRDVTGCCSCAYYYYGICNARIVYRERPKCTPDDFCWYHCNPLVLKWKFADVFGVQWLCRSNCWAPCLNKWQNYYNNGAILTCWKIYSKILGTVSLARHRPICQTEIRQVKIARFLRLKSWKVKGCEILTYMGCYTAWLLIRRCDYRSKCINTVQVSLGLQELIRRWDSERELWHSVPRKLPEFAEITQNNAITPFKVIQGRRFWYQSKGHIRFPIVINTNLPPILYRFRDIAVDRSEIAILGYPSCV